MAENNSTLVHKKVGLVRIKEICTENGLTEGDEKEIHQILTEWEKLVGNFTAKMKVVQRVSGRNLRCNQILRAMTAITVEFASVQLKTAKR